MPSLGKTYRSKWPIRPHKYGPEQVAVGIRLIPMILYGFADSPAAFLEMLVIYQIAPHLTAPPIAEVDFARTETVEVPKDLGRGDDTTRGPLSLSPFLGTKGREVRKVAVGKPSSVGGHIPAVLEPRVDLGPCPGEAGVPVRGE